MILGWLYRSIGIDVDSIRENLAKSKALISDQVTALQVLAPIGWAPTMYAPATAYQRAREIIESDGPIADAEQELLTGWNTGRTLYFQLVRVKTIGAGHDRLGPIANSRWNLVGRALAHHRAEAFEASVPIVLAQIDGIVRDLCGGNVSFFEDSTKSAHHFHDDSSLIGLPQGFEPLRKLFSAHSKTTGATGAISRHGILHGRELGYDTLINSTKAFVLLIAILDWAQPKAQKMVEEQQRERERKYAGSMELDESGRRKDRRGFPEAKQDLGNVDLLQTCYMREHGRYTDDPAKLLGTTGSWWSFDLEATHLATSSDSKGYWVWRSTPTGYCFGSAGHVDTNGTWHYGNQTAPVGGPWECEGWHHVRNDPAHPEW